jgi:hypothetical protein
VRRLVTDRGDARPDVSGTVERSQEGRHKAGSTPLHPHERPFVAAISLKSDCNVTILFPADRIVIHADEVASDSATKDVALQGNV